MTVVDMARGRYDVLVWPKWYGYQSKRPRVKTSHSNKQHRKTITVLQPLAESTRLSAGSVQVGSFQVQWLWILKLRFGGQSPKFFPAYRCSFHWCQCLWRKIQELGLVRAYLSDHKVHTNQPSNCCENVLTYWL